MEGDAVELKNFEAVRKIIYFEGIFLRYDRNFVKAIWNDFSYTMCLHVILHAYLWVGSDVIGQLHYVYTPVLLNCWDDTE